MGEDTLYWNRNWLSLDDYLSKEELEEALKRESKERLTIAPSEARKKEAKLHQDNVSKHRKIREIFGNDQSHHPNQVISKRYLPSQGLCEQEVMYLLGCKVFDFQVLAVKGKLTMDPWDFVRWRVGRLYVQKRRFNPGSNAPDVKSIINNITSERSEDPLFRQAILYSAHLQGKSSSYGSKKKTVPYFINGEEQTGSQLRAGRVVLAGRPRAPASTQMRKTPYMDRDAIRREKRARLAESHPSTYQGVNAYRQQKGNGLGPCGG